MPLTALLIDDEPLTREGLKMLLTRDPNIADIHEAKDERHGIEAIRTLSPDLVFLNVQMPEINKFEVVHQIGTEEMPALVFMTAHDRYAIQAFEISAIDYLLKPVTEERFAKALDRAKAHLKARNTNDANSHILSLLENISMPRQHVKRLTVRSANKTVFVDVANINWIEAAENYVQLHTGQTPRLLHVTMNTLEKSLNPDLFLHIHRSIIINVTRMRKLQPLMHEKYILTLHNDIRLQSNRTYNEKLKSLTTNPF